MQPEAIERRAEWFLLHAGQKDLDWAVEQLGHEGLDAFVPLALGDDTLSEAMPLFPGYIFAFLDPTADIPSLERHFEKIKFVTNSSWRPMPIPDSIVTELKGAERSVFHRNLSIMAHEYRVEELLAEVFHRRNC